jgi:hypothetical protein
MKSREYNLSRKADLREQSKEARAKRMVKASGVMNIYA